MWQHLALERNIYQIKISYTMIRKITTQLLVALSATLLLASCGGAVATSDASTSPADYVNPLVGTLSEFALSTGNTYPAIARPWGMNFWSPQTGKMGNGWMYKIGRASCRERVFWIV